MSFTASINGGSCNCCGGGGICYIDCSTRGGVASLCGFDEFVSPSVPPKKYRTLAHSGIRTIQYYDDAVCSSNKGTIVLTYSGSDKYGASDCSFVSTGNENIVDTPVSGPVSNTNGPIGPWGTDCQVGDSETRTNRHHVPTSVCCLTGPSVYQKTSVSSVADNLSDEDKDSDAIDRLFAGPAGEWSPFSPDGACTAFYTERGAGVFTIGYREAKYKIRASGLEPFSDYDATVKLYRRVYGTGEFELFEERTSTITGDEFGFYEGPEELVSNDIGYETYAGGCAISSLL